MDNPLFQLIVPLVLAGGALTWLMPSGKRKPRAVGGVLGAIAIFLLSRLTSGSGSAEHDVLFHVFSAVALMSGGLMVTDKNPAYAALWFALVTLSVCGLFVVQSAPFLAAASVIVYAGAIIVTFMFVLMLASQSGKTGYDQRPQHAVFAITAGLVFLGLVVGAVQRWHVDESPSGVERRLGVTTATLSASELARVQSANPLSRLAPANNDGEVPAFGTLRQLGRSLFGDYLFAVEVAGTLLLVAAIGAIAIAPRRSQGTL